MEAMRLVGTDADQGTGLREDRLDRTERRQQLRTKIHAHAA
jgi:hypothetical protein